MSRDQAQGYVIVTEFTWFEKPKCLCLAVHKLIDTRKVAGVPAQPLRDAWRPG